MLSSPHGSRALVPNPAMKTLFLVPLVFVTPALRAENLPLPEFNSKSIDLPPLSLADISKGAAGPKTFSMQMTPPRSVLPVLSYAPSTSRRVDRASGMPILTPNPDVDYKMIVKSPEPSTDFKMIVRDPSTEVAADRGRPEPSVDSTLKK